MSTQEISVYLSKSTYKIFDIAQYEKQGTPRGKLYLSFAPGKEYPIQEDLQNIKACNIQVIVCLLENWELQCLNISNYPKRAQEMGFYFYHIPIRDGTSPSQKELDSLIPILIKHLSLGNNILVHCRSGYGRAGTVCACCLRYFGLQGKQAISYVRNKRPGAITTSQQENCILQYCR